MKHTTTRAFTRVTLELTGPCSIGTGDQDLASDMPFVIDANGLPTLPGSSLAGMLRAAARQVLGEDEIERWFGYQRGRRGQGSRVWFTSAHVHDERDVPIDGQRREAPGPFLDRISQGEVRDHVRIDAWGTADERGKFDQQVLLGGTRFTFDLEIVAGPDERDEVTRLRDLLLGLLKHPATRLGGRIHSGLGGFTVRRARGEIFDLRDAQDFRAYAALPVRLDRDIDAPLVAVTPIEDARLKLARVDVSLKSRDFFVFGGGDAIEEKLMKGDEAADILPVKKSLIWWSGSAGNISDRAPYAPATAIKGALSHRVAFHANRLASNFIPSSGGGNVREAILNTTGEDNHVVEELFGFQRGAKDDSDEKKEATGKVIVEDILIDGETRRMMHTSLDHYTQGVRMNMLFDEEVFEPGTKLDFTLYVESPDTLSAHARQALRMALEDLCAGRLALGAGESRGHGHFEGEITRWDIEEAAHDDA